MRIAGLALVLLCGCTQLLGLDDVETSDRDLDADGVLDSDDNCRGLPNPNQSDSDEDGVGNACDMFSCDEPGVSLNRDVDGDGVDDGCDPCRLGFNDDEDADGIYDPCDRCPGTADPDQADADLDGLGDACESQLAADLKQGRVFFDGFGQAPHPWIDPNWIVRLGALVLQPPGLDTSVANAVASGEHWSIEMAIELPAVAELNEYIAIILKDEVGDDRYCRIDADLPSSGFRLGGVLGPMPAFGDVLLPAGSTVVLRMNRVSKSEWSCEAVKVGAEATAEILDGKAFRIRIGGIMPMARVRYIDVTR